MYVQRNSNTKTSSFASEEVCQEVGTCPDNHQALLFWEDDGRTMLPAGNSNVMALFSTSEE
jgi:hypothetical protein